MAQPNDFMSAFREAKEAGMSTDQFIALWKLQQQMEMEEKAWQRKREESEWMHHELLREGDRAKAPQTRPHGYIGRFPNHVDIAIGEIMAKHEPDNPVVQTFQMTKKEDSPKPVKPPTPMPRHKEMKLHPPDYQEAQYFNYADQNEIQQGTEIKFPLRNDSDSESSSDDINYDPPSPSSAALRRLNAEQQTERKVPSDFDDDTVVFSKEDQTELLTTVKRLQEEQVLLKATLTKHANQLTTLSEKQPSIRKTLRKKATPISSMYKDDQGEEETSVKDIAETNHLYVQIEQLYANFCKIHMPANAVRWMHRVKQASTILRLKDNTADQFACRENSEGYWDITSVQENMALQKENEELKQRMRELEEKFSQQSPKKEEVKKTSPESVPGISSLSSICNIGLTYQQNLTEGKYVNLKRSPWYPADLSFVPGCPEKSRPGKGAATPVEMAFEWSISNYASTFDEECSRQNLKTVSKPFYISHHGYLVRLEVYLNGIDSGQGRCMSVFLRVLKGKYDQQLQWPLRLCFIVVMVNQVDDRQQSLKGGSNGVTEFTYCKPTGCADDNSDCWGFVEFVSHSMIVQNQYIRNDSILFNIKLKIM